MSWDLHHTESERLAGEAESALRDGDHQRAHALYRRAAEAEDRALAALDVAKSRTRGITAVSALSLWFKAADLAAVRLRGEAMLADESLPRFASLQIREILESARETSGPERKFEVEVTVRQTLRFAVDAANRQGAEQQAITRWKRGHDAGSTADEDLELLEVHARPLSRHTR